MKSEWQQIFDSIPEDAPRSRLEPYRELILRWRRQGRSIRRICTLLSDRCSVKIGKTALHQFVQLRSRPRKPQAEPETEQLPLTPVPTNQATDHPKSRQTSSADAYAEARERMRRHKEAPTAAHSAKVFEVPEEDLDCTKPLRMMSPTTKEK